MIKNIIFDMGNVLIKYDPELFIERAGISDEFDKRSLMNSIFKSSGWQEMDMGILDEHGMFERAMKVLPEYLWDVAYDLIYEWDKPLIPVEGMFELVKWCREKGYKLYLLSNASVRQPEYWYDTPIHEYFDGAVVSALEKETKPFPQIYYTLLRRYALKAEECLFIDDVEINVKTAKALGMDGWLFKNDAGKLKEYIEKLQ